MIACALSDATIFADRKSNVAIYASAPTSDGRPFSSFGGIGTGGFGGLHFVKTRQGYQPFILIVKENGPQATNSPYVDLMKEVKAGFGRTMSQIPAVFGVSRQTLYNWLSGEIPKEQHHGKLVQLAAAARVFVDMGFKPTSLGLDRTVANGKSFVELLSEGADGTEIAQRLVRIAMRGTRSREKLDALLGDRAAPYPSRSEIG